MNQYILFMHNDAAASADNPLRWEQYIKDLQASGQFDGGSSIGEGVLCKKNMANQPAPVLTNGFIRIRAESLDAAQRFLIGNPTYEAGGTVEIRELLKD